MKKFFILFLVCVLYFAPIVSAKPNKTFTKIGDWGQVILPVSAAAISYIKEKDYKGVGQFAKTYASTMLVTYGLKYTVKAKRPKGGKHSFPSGHSSSAFSSASFLAFRYGYKYGIPAYLGAIAVGASRIDAKAHHVRDVVGSAVISVVSGYIFTTSYKDDIKISAVPVQGGGGQVNLEIPL